MGAYPDEERERIRALVDAGDRASLVEAQRLILARVDGLPTQDDRGSTVMADDQDELSVHDRIESTLGPGWSKLVPHLAGNTPPTVDHKPGRVWLWPEAPEEAADLQAALNDLRAVLAALVLDHGVDGRLVLSERAMIQAITVDGGGAAMSDDHRAQAP